MAEHLDVTVIAAPRPADWPFLHPLVPFLPDGNLVVRADGIHEAFINRQTGNTRLVSTQPNYLLQTWIHAAAARRTACPDEARGNLREQSRVKFVFSADFTSLADHAPEVLAKRAAWALPHVDVIAQPSESSRETGDDRSLSPLARAMRVADPAERLALCVRALDDGRSAPALIAAASTCMEVNDLDAAARNLEEALAIAPDWPAAHFEQGKLWLRRDDLLQASDAFRSAATLLPTFTSAWSNLGATLGELDRPEEALRAFETALALEPLNPQALNNIGVLRRELGQLDASEAAFRRVIHLVPELAFGHYNLGHTLFLQGRYQAALSAYVEGQRRDVERNAVQASRLALCRLATGDSAGALIDLRQATSALPMEYKRRVLSDTQTAAWALLTHRADLSGWRAVADWIGTELGRLE